MNDFDHPGAVPAFLVGHAREEVVPCVKLSLLTILPLVSWYGVQPHTQLADDAGTEDPRRCRRNLFVGSVLVDGRLNASCPVRRELDSGSAGAALLLLLLPPLPLLAVRSLQKSMRVQVEMLHLHRRMVSAHDCHS